MGAVASPLLCNVYLHRLDRCWAAHGAGMLVRFADDLVVMCHSRVEAERALAALRAILAEQGLTLKDAKTGIVELREGGEGLDFLGLHHRWVRGNTPGSRHLCFLVRWPRREKMQHARGRLRELTLRRRLLSSVDEVVGDLNEYLRGFAGYFRYGNSARSFGLLDDYATDRLALFLAKRHKKKRGYGYWRIARSPDRMGLIRITGTVVAPRPNRAWTG
ncbi:MAG: group II intron maturase-specific domain-containing protein [Solirubrobacteraceae bacterium]